LKRQNTKAPVVQEKEEVISTESKIKRMQNMNNPLIKLTLRVTTRWYRAP